MVELGLGWCWIKGGVSGGRLLTFVRPNPPPLSVLVRVMILRLTCITPKLVVA